MNPLLHSARPQGPGSRLTLGLGLALALAPWTPPAAAPRLDPITVSTRLPADPARRAEAVRVLDAATLDRLAPVHANEVLQRIPGAWASRGSGQEQLLALRSPVLTGPGACGAFLVLDDGMPTRPAGFCNVNQLWELDFATAGRLEVLRGPGSAVHGSNALHGVVAVTPRRPGSGSMLRLEAGGSEHRRVVAALDRESLRLDASWLEAESFRAEEAQRLGRLGLQAQLGESTALSVSNHRLRQETAGFVFGEGAWRDPRRTANLNPEAFRHADARRLVLTHEQPLGAASLLLRPYARHDAQHFLQHFALGQPLEESGSHSFGVQMQIEYDGLRLGLDLEAASGWLRQTQARPLTTGTPAQNAIRPVGRHFDYRVESRQWAVYAERQWRYHQDAWTLGGRWERLAYRHDNRMAAGNLRADGQACGFGGCLFLRPEDRRDRFSGNSLQLGWVRQLPQGWSLGARAARAFRFPQATELYRLQRGQTVEGFAPETVDSLEALLRYDSPAFAFAATGYAMDKDDVILRDAEGLSVPNARTRHHGLELELRWQPEGHAWLELQLAWSEQRYAFDRLLPGNERIRRGARIDTAPEWLGGLQWGGRLRQQLTAELELAWQGAYPIDAANTRRYSGHLLGHLRLRQALGDSGWLGLRVMNLADRRYAERVDFAFGEVRSFPGAGREVFLEWGWQPGRSRSSG